MIKFNESADDEIKNSTLKNLIKSHISYYFFVNVMFYHWLYARKTEKKNLKNHGSPLKF